MYHFIVNLELWRQTSKTSRKNVERLCARQNKTEFKISSICKDLGVAESYEVFVTQNFIGWIIDFF